MWDSCMECPLIHARFTWTRQNCEVVWIESSVDRYRRSNYRLAGGVHISGTKNSGLRRLSKQDYRYFSNQELTFLDSRDFLYTKTRTRSTRAIFNLMETAYIDALVHRYVEWALFKMEKISGLTFLITNI